MIGPSKPGADLKASDFIEKKVFIKKTVQKII